MPREGPKALIAEATRSSRPSEAGADAAAVRARSPTTWAWTAWSAALSVDSSYADMWLPDRITPFGFISAKAFAADGPLSQADPGFRPREPQDRLALAVAWACGEDRPAAGGSGEVTRRNNHHYLSASAGLDHKRFDNAVAGIQLNDKTVSVSALGFSGDLADGTHGGATMTLMDVGMATASRSVQPELGVVTIEMKTSFMQPARGRLTVKGRLLHRTTSLAFTEATVFDASGRVCAHATGTFKYVRRTAAERAGVSGALTAQISTD